METHQIKLPVPPSINRMYRVFRNRVFLVKEGKEYKETVGRLCREQLGKTFKPMTGPVALTIKVYRPAKRGDLDNFLKCLLDGLQGVLYKNDKQVAEIHAYRFDSKENPRVEVIANG